MMVSYQDLCKTRVLSSPCPICGKRPNVKDAKFVKVGGKKFWVCKHHHVEEDE